MNKQKYLFPLIALILLSCHSGTHKQQSVKNPFVDSLKESRVGNSDYFISLPRDFSVRQKSGPDFTVYYFAPADSTAKEDFSGGVYMGNFPTEFKPANDSCKTSTLKSDLLDAKRDWKLFSCDSSFFIQTVVTNKDDSKLHAFGHGTTEDNMRKMLDVFTTFRKER